MKPLHHRLQGITLNLLVIMLGLFFILGSGDSPVITILGDNPVVVIQGSNVHDAGATAEDTEDGKVDVVTSGLIIANEVGRYKTDLEAGDYTVTYTATDQDGNVATAERTVNIVAFLEAPSLTAITGDKSVNLTWTAVNNATKYSVCYAKESLTDFDNCSTFLDGVLLIDITDTQKEITSLTNGTTYYFQVVAFDKNDNSSEASDEKLATPTIITLSTGRLNDTGITQCANDSSANLACPISTHPKQDAESGRDSTHNDDSDGHAGFSFTKISSTGAQLPAPATRWSCVKDNVTGLIWEVKTTSGGLHDKNNTYTWYNPDTSTNGGSAGIENGSADTDSFVSDVNTAGYCGAHDWRLPNIDELGSIVDYSAVHPGPMIDTNYFPNTTPSVVWSSSPVARGANYAWAVNFYTGYDYWYNKYNDKQVRLVRSGQ